LKIERRELGKGKREKGRREGKAGKEKKEIISEVDLVK
jgi:hypothetical protein